MKSLEIIEVLENYGKRIFTLGDVAKITGKSRKYVSLLLSKNKNFRRIERGKYYLKDASIYEIASNIILPSYISSLAAFRYYNLITQMPNTIDVIATRQHKELQIEGYKIKFVKFRKKSVFGYKTEDGATVAYPEKAIIDALYVNLDYTYITEAFENCKDIDIKKLQAYAIDMMSKVVVNKLGFLLESFNIDAKNLLKYRSMRYAVISEGQKTNSKWRVKYA